MKFILPVLLATVLSACAELEVVTPNPRVEPPETRGEAWRFKLGGSASSSHRYKATQQANKRPPDLTDPSVTGHYDFSPTGGLSLADRFDMAVEWNMIGTGVNLLAKFQLLGDGTLSAKQGNVPIAIFARTGRSKGSNDGDQSVTFGPGSYPWRGEIVSNFVQGGVSGGYRPKDFLLVWGGAAVGKYWNDIKITQDPGGGDPGGTYTKDSTGDGFTVSGGVMFSWPKFQVYVAGEQVHVDYNDDDAMDQTSVHTGVFFTP